MLLPMRFWLKIILLMIMAWCTTHRAQAHTSVALLDGKLTLEMQDGFVPDEKRLVKHVLAAYKGRQGSAWGVISRGRNGLKPEEIAEYLTKKSAEYTKGLSWLPRLTWLKKDTVMMNGRRWADLRFIGQSEGAKSPMDGMLYTRILATSYEGQLLEIVFTSNTDRDPDTKTKIDRILDSVQLAD